MILPLADKDHPLPWLMAIEKMAKQKSYKPILLLSIIAEIEQGTIVENKISLSESIINQFNDFYRNVGNQQALNKAHLPYYYLQTDIWDLNWRKNVSKKPPSSINGIRKNIKNAVLRPHLFSLLQDKKMREIIKERLFLKAEEDIRYKDPQRNETFIPPTNIPKILANHFGEIQVHMEPEQITPLFDPITLDFAQEKILQEFLVQHWNSIPYFQEHHLQIFGGIDQGVEYDTKTVGRIDILAEDRRTKDFTIIELKRGKSGEHHLGQLLRYMGWVRSKLSHGREVYGVLIASMFQDSIRYAIQELQQVSLMEYKVEFRLHPLEF